VTEAVPGARAGQRRTHTPRRSWHHHLELRGTFADGESAVFWTAGVSITVRVSRVDSKIIFLGHLIGALAKFPKEILGGAANAMGYLSIVYSLYIYFAAVRPTG